MRLDQIFLLSLGSNVNGTLSDRVAWLDWALARMPRFGVTVEARSRMFRTPCFPAGAGPDFANAAARVRARMGARELLEILHEIEAEAGRVRDRRWGQRVLDLDLLAADGQVLPDRATHDRWRQLPLAAQMAETPDGMILPHPRIQDRAFVLVPLCDVASDWRHPVLGRTAAEMCAALPPGDRAAVTAI